MGNVSAKESRSEGTNHVSTRSRNNSSGNHSSSQNYYQRRSNRKQKDADKSNSNNNGGNLVLDPNDVVDGGYLAPHGVYSGPPTYKYKVVRQLMIERRLAPFFKGLPDYDEDWNDRQLLAALRGLPIPPAENEDDNEDDDYDYNNDESLNTTTTGTEDTYNNNNSSTVNTTIDEQNEDDDDENHLSTSAPNGKSCSLLSGNKDSTDNEEERSSLVPPHRVETSSSGSSELDPEMQKILEMKGEAFHVEYSSISYNNSNRSQSISIGGDNSNVGTGPTTATNPAATTTTTRQRANTSSKYKTSDNPNEKPVESMVYKGAIECPICFLYYPKYLNHTRCCAQPICSECFVEIKRADPHPPHNHDEGNDTPGSSSQSDATNANKDSVPELISESACCPYCTVPDFGVVYIPPPIRSGIQSESSSSKLHLPSLLNNSKTNNNNIQNDGQQQQQQPRRHRTSVPASAPEVVTTDRIRPDWSSQLNSARQKQARRSAAANALHATAFVMNQDGTSNQRNGNNSNNNKKNKKSSRFRGMSTNPSIAVGNGRTIQSTSGASSSRQASQGLEDMMLVEAIRLSLSEEENRKKKEKEERKKNKGKQPAIF